MEDGRTQRTEGVNRRAFIGALGAAAVAGALTSAADAQSPPPPVYNYLDSFGSIQPCAADTIAAGVLPPPIAVQAPSNGPQERRRRHWPFGPRSHGAKHQFKAGPRSSGGGCIYNPPDCAAQSPTAPSAGYPAFNILMIIVDQMRAPRWLPQATPGVSGALNGQPAIDAILPNVASIRNQSFVFSNYFVAATACSPSRATLLTGLYSQQTCVFVSQDPPSGLNPAYPPALQPWSGGQGFPSIGNVLSQTQNTATGAPALGYDCVWIGKWHLSDNPTEDTVEGYLCNPGGDGPADYGFADLYNIPTPLNPPTNYPAGPYPSSTGDANVGNAGYFLGNAQTGHPWYGDVPNYLGNNPPLSPTSSGTPLGPAPYSVLNDAAVADAFGIWLQDGAKTSQKWFAAVSFMNPHDINSFPYAFGLAQSQCPPSGSQPNFCYEDNGVVPAGSYAFYAPPPAPTSSTRYQSEEYPVEPETTALAGFPGNPEGTDTQLYSQGAPPLTLNPVLYSGDPSFPSGYNPGWNNNDPITPYNPPSDPNTGKPSLQTAFQSLGNTTCGEVNNDAGWYIFLNYYFWMQACVDILVGQVLTALKQSAFADNTVIIFTADHGEYAGSHGLHGKGGALYDESISVPLYIGFPGQQNKVPRSFVCSSVDILPFLYTLALGNDSWRRNGCDIVNYLNGREAIMDAIMLGTQNAPQRRLSGFPLTNPQGSAAWQQY